MFDIQVGEPRNSLKQTHISIIFWLVNKNIQAYSRKLVKLGIPFASIPLNQFKQPTGEEKKGEKIQIPKLQNTWIKESTNDSLSDLGMLIN